MRYCQFLYFSLITAALYGCESVQPSSDQAALESGNAPQAEEARVAAARDYKSVVVDSARPIEEEIRRFREGLTGAVELAGEPSIDVLMRRFVTALAAQDTASLKTLLVDASEFIDLYYPHTRYVARPYELSPGLMWYQMENYTGRGLRRLLAQLSGRPLEYAGYRCETTAQTEGPNRIWDGCVALVGVNGRPSEPLPSFGPILERDSQFKFLSLSARL